MSERDRPTDEMEVTEEMAAAGANVLSDLFDSATLDGFTREAAKSVYVAMYPKRKFRWNTEEEVEACAIVVEMELRDGHWVTVGRRQGRLFRTAAGGATKG
jgi:hypothetical protein